MSSQTKKILVTGGAGFIGSFLVDRLIKSGHRVTIYDNLEPQVHPHGQPSYLNEEAQFIKGDVRDYDNFKKVIVSSEMIYHLAAAVGVAQSQYEIKRYVDVNIGGTANLMDCLVNNKHNVEKIMVATSMTSYGEGNYRCKKCGIVRPEIRTEDDVKTGWEPRCPLCDHDIVPVPTDEGATLNAHSIYALTKMVQEEMILNIGKTFRIPSVALRLFNVFGPRQSLSNPYTGVTAIFISRIKNNHEPVVFEDGFQTRDFISVHDAVRVMEDLLETESAHYELFNIGSGKPITIADIAQKIIDALGKKDIQPKITGKFRKGDIRHCYADIQRAQKILRFNPKVSFDDGLKELITWAQNSESEDHFDRAAQELIDKKLVES